MNKMMSILAVLFLFYTPIASASDHANEHASTAKHEKSHWGYAGKQGPDYWGELEEGFKTCKTGNQQSPVDLVWSKQKGAHPIEFAYHNVKGTIVDNGHTIQVDVAPGSFVKIDGKKYNLLQFHFHSLSEHTFSGKQFPLEAHFVHKDEQGKLAVVGVMFDLGGFNKSLNNVFTKIPSKTNEKLDIGMVNPMDLFPKAKTHYHYMGSLTTPPCSEGVSWNVLNTSVSLSPEQLEKFNAFYAHNNRPVQALHDRKPANYR